MGMADTVRCDRRPQVWIGSLLAGYGCSEQCEELQQCRIITPVTFGFHWTKPIELFAKSLGRHVQIALGRSEAHLAHINR